MSNGNHTLFIQGFLKRIANQFNISINEAFEVFSIAAILDKPFDEVYHSIVIKGKNDGGIDGVYFQENQDDYVMYVFQCKNTETLKQNEIDKFRNDFKDVFIDGNKVKKSNLDDLTPSIEKYTHYSENLGRRIIPNLFFIFNGDKQNKENANARIFEQFHQEEFFEIWDKDDLFHQIGKLIDSNKKGKALDFIFRPSKSNITALTDNQGLISFSIYEVKAALFRIPAYQICELLENAEKINGTMDRIFAENIRGFLGKDNLTNQKIIETLNSTNKVYFPFLNNGITIICDRFSLPNTTQVGEYPLRCVNPFIVNGLQTSYILYNLYKSEKEKLLGVDVTVRLYETQDPDLVELITDATNTQSAIDGIDKLSNKKFNILAKSFFENKGVAYLTKKGEAFTNPLTIQGAPSVRSEEVIQNWGRIMLGGGQIENTRMFRATFDKNDTFYPFFSGSPDSPLYSQLFFVYQLVKKVENDYNGVGDKMQFLELSTAYLFEKQGLHFTEKDVDFALEKVYNAAFLKEILESDNHKEYYFRGEIQLLHQELVEKKLGIKPKISVQERVDFLSKLYVNYSTLL